MDTPRCLVFALCLAASLAAPAQTTGAVQAAPATIHPAYPGGAGTPLGEAIAALLTEPSAARGHWGIAVTALDGTPIYGLDEGQLFRPASNAKLFTTTAAMALLGPDSTVTTTVRGRLDGAGTVVGDLTLVGAGDADFGTNDLPYVEPADRVKNAPRPTSLQDLSELVDKLTSLGVKHVTGAVVGYDWLFPHQRFSGTWDVGDLVWGYGAPVSALTVADNELALTVTHGMLPGPGGEPGSNASAALDQNGVPYYTLDSDVRTTPAGTGAHVDVERLPGERILHLYGTMAADSSPDVEQVSIDDPALYASIALRTLLAERGITVDGNAVADHQPLQDATSYLSEVTRPPTSCDPVGYSGVAQGCSTSCMSATVPGRVLVSHASVPLAEDVTFTLKESQNLHAELLLHRLGRLGGCGQGSTAEGARMVRLFVLSAGVDPGDFIFYDGSGLSSHDLVTPRATAQLLSFATKQPWFARWKAALPIGGVDGTLSARFKQPPLQGHVFAKTGTLGESRALSGYLDCASGREVIFSIFADDHFPGSSADRAAMDKIVAAIAANE
jgi:D-alanyl-D-alanine carboxypeptidase/D-alanyl-D-alanine-endopeptidase (penicillin-binding protein 4)